MNSNGSRALLLVHTDLQLAHDLSVRRALSIAEYGLIHILHQKPGCCAAAQGVGNLIGHCNSLASCSHLFHHTSQLLEQGQDAIARGS